MSRYIFHQRSRGLAFVATGDAVFVPDAAAPPEVAGFVDLALTAPATEALAARALPLAHRVAAGASAEGWLLCTDRELPGLGALWMRGTVTALPGPETRVLVLHFYVGQTVDKGEVDAHTRAGWVVRETSWAPRGKDDGMGLEGRLVVTLERPAAAPA